jgi:hypothetical protein
MRSHLVAAGALRSPERPGESVCPSAWNARSQEQDSAADYDASSNDKCCHDESNEKRTPLPLTRVFEYCPALRLCHRLDVTFVPRSDRHPTGGAEPCVRDTS